LPPAVRRGAYAVRAEIRALAAAIELLDFLVIPKAAIQDSELILAETVSVVLALARGVIMVPCPLYQVPKSSARKLSVFPHAKPLFRRHEPVTSNIECASRSIREQFREFDFLVRRHVGPPDISFEALGAARRSPSPSCSRISWHRRPARKVQRPALACLLYRVGKVRRVPCAAFQRAPEAILGQLLSARLSVLPDFFSQPARRFAKFRCARPTIWVPRNTGLETLAGNTASALFSLFPRCFICIHRACSRASKIERISLRTIARALEHPWNKTLSLWGDFQQLQGRKAIESSGFMERAMGIEPIATHG
jgi:hypothetical protein